MSLLKKKVKKACIPSKEELFLEKKSSSSVIKRREEPGSLEENATESLSNSIEEDDQSPLQKYYNSPMISKREKLKREKSSVSQEAGPQKKIKLDSSPAFSLSQKERSKGKEISTKKESKSPQLDGMEEQESKLMKRDIQNREELKPFKVVDPSSLSDEDMRNCMRVYGVAKENGILYCFMITELSVQVKGSFRYLPNEKLENIAEKVYGEKKGKKWSAWKAKNGLYVRNTYEEITEEEEEMMKAD